jgi:hypothetical protein
MSSINQAIMNKARADKFLLVLSLPPVLRDINTPILSARTQDLIQEDSLQFSIWGTIVPSISVPQQETRHSGQSYNVTGQSRPAYPPITVNFTIDNNFNNYWMLWKWLDKMNKIRESGMDSHFADKNISNSVGSNGHKFTDYQTTMTIYALDEYDNRVAQFDYYNAFLTEVGDIQYNYRTENELESSFSFVFNQMDIILLESGEPAGQ